MVWLVYFHFLGRDSGRYGVMGRGALKLKVWVMDMVVMDTVVVEITITIRFQRGFLAII